jgi:hypothetical protein
MANATFPVATVYLIPFVDVVGYDTSEYSNTVRDAIAKAEAVLRGPAEGRPLAALIFEGTTHVVTTFEGEHKALELRFRLAAQLWLRMDGRIDSRVYQSSESPWGAVLP